MAQNPPVSLDSLPSEILIHILESFPTRTLLPLATVCHRFQALVCRVHYGRLVDAVALKEHELILECYHPSAKISTPYLYCDYLGTDGLEEDAAGQDPPMRAMNDCYSRFRPVLQEEDRRPRARYPTRRAKAQSSQQQELAAAVETPSQDVHLDACELFSQLCTGANLVKAGPKPGLFLGHVNIAEGVIRVWRDWLAREAAKTAEARAAQRATLGTFESSILWADSSMNVGLRMRAAEVADMRAPVLVGPDDEPPISYKLEFEELLIRTNQLVLSMEKSSSQKVIQSVTLQELLSSRPRAQCTGDHIPQFSFARDDWNAEGYITRWKGRDGQLSAPVKMLAALTLASAVRAVDNLMAYMIETGWSLRDGLGVPMLVGVALAQRCRKILRIK